MHLLEPFYSWRKYYIASEDERSPFYGREYSEFEFTHAIYNYLIHPQWDDFGSETLYLKILFTDYDKGFTIIEFLGEWNDTLYNDVMFLKREVVDPLVDHGIDKFILIGENILNFHASDDSYYEEWFDDVEDGWIAGINFQPHVQREFIQNNMDYYIAFSDAFDQLNWRNLSPQVLFHQIHAKMIKRLGM
ncbi:MAG: hypothetical protein V2I54_01095 [Bacteroidales bacterium]|jgi:hypothetical protein|nr:hypothetical protein [Bacteroidales bacterium]